MAKKDRNGAANCKDDTVTEDEEAESDRAQTKEEDLGTRITMPSCQLTDHTVQETVLWSFFPTYL